MISTNLLLIPVFSITSLACSTLSLLDVLYGIIIPSTFSGPKAFAAKKATRAESIPPERPSTTFLNPTFPASSLKKFTSISSKTLKSTFSFSITPPQLSI